MIYDVAIIGAGIIGGMLARELSRYQLGVCLLEKKNELTRAAGIPMDPITNSAIVDESCQTAVPGIFACGNVLQVHDLVDYVSEKAERAGIGAARWCWKTCLAPGF